METNRKFANRAASLSAGIAASVMMVVVCFALALVLSDRPIGGEAPAKHFSVSDPAGGELAQASH